MPQTEPCLAPVPNPSCAGDGTPLDFGVRLVNDDGTTSDVHRISEFGALVPYLRSNITGFNVFQQQPGTPPLCFIRLNEPVFDTVVLPLRDFKLDGQPFPYAATTRLRIDFDGAASGTIGVRNVGLLGAIAAPEVSRRR